MTQAEWLACAHAGPMLEFLRSRASDRKLRLFACACARSVWRLLRDERSKDMVRVAERYADGEASWEVLFEAMMRNDSAPWVDESEAARREAINAARASTYHDAAHAATEAATSALWATIEETALAHPHIYSTGSDAPEHGSQVLMLSCMFGNPFRPLPPRPRAIAPLAEEIYGGRWELMPLLGEWLQEHGFWTEGEHCLDPSIRHVKGCWVVDWVTGRE
jgi:hypothetical protein